MTGVSFFTTEAHERSINELACKEYAGTANETQDSHIHDESSSHPMRSKPS